MQQAIPSFTARGFQQPGSLDPAAGSRIRVPDQTLPFLRHQGVDDAQETRHNTAPWRRVTKVIKPVARGYANGQQTVNAFTSRVGAPDNRSLLQMQRIAGGDTRNTAYRH